MIIGRITIPVQDAKGKRSSVRFYVRDSGALSAQFEVSDVLEYATMLAEQLDVLIGGVVGQPSVTFTAAPSSNVKALPDADSDVEEIARIEYAYSSLTPLSPFSNTLPSFKHSLFSGAQVLDSAALYNLPNNANNIYGISANFFRILSDAGLADFGGTDMQPCDSRGDDLQAPSQAERLFRR